MHAYLNASAETLAAEIRTKFNIDCNARVVGEVLALSRRMKSPMSPGLFVGMVSLGTDAEKVSGEIVTL